ncbi:MAG TPA: hypothetical protein VMR81_05675 [Patescibacteria group bacterium]|nr:hypothetical protein [Patescibacteria group bacterium]
MAIESPQWLSDWTSNNQEQVFDVSIEERYDENLEETGLVIHGQLAVSQFDGDTTVAISTPIEVVPNEDEDGWFMDIEARILELDSVVAEKMDNLIDVLESEWHRYETEVLSKDGIILNSGIGDPDADEEAEIPYVQIETGDEDEGGDHPGISLFWEEASGKDPREVLNAKTAIIQTLFPYFRHFTQWFIENRLPEIEAHLAQMHPDWPKHVLQNYPNAHNIHEDQNEDTTYVYADLTVNNNGSMSETPVRIRYEDANSVNSDISVNLVIWSAATDADNRLLNRTNRLAGGLRDDWGKFTTSSLHKAYKRAGLTDDEIDAIRPYFFLLDVFTDKSLPSGISLSPHLFGQGSEFTSEDSLASMLSVLPKLYPEVRRFLENFFNHRLPELEKQREMNTKQKPDGIIGLWASTPRQYFVEPKHEWIEPEMGLDPYIELIAGKIVGATGTVLDGYEIALTDYTNEYHEEQMKISIKLPQYVVRAIEANQKQFTELMRNLQNDPQSLPVTPTIGDIQLPTDLEIMREINGNHVFILMHWIVNREVYTSLKTVGWTKQIILGELYPQCMNMFFAWQPHLETFASGFKTTS